jgi:Ca2+:H+ antiporter
MEKEHEKAGKQKLTVIEAIVAVVIGITCVSFMAYYLVDQIPYIVKKRHVKDAFVGLIMIPLVEKAAEHITAIDEAYEGHLNSAMAHVLGSSIQTALLNTPLIVLVGWGIKVDMNLNFRIFDAAVLILAIIVVGNFLHHRKSNYLEGLLCVIVYIVSYFGKNNSTMI